MSAKGQGWPCNNTFIISLIKKNLLSLANEQIIIFQAQPWPVSVINNVVLVKILITNASLKILPFFSFQKNPLIVIFSLPMEICSIFINCRQNLP